VLSLREIGRLLAAGWRQIVLSVCVVTLLGTVLSLVMTPSYRATVLVAHATDTQEAGGSLAALAGGLGGLSGLADLAGLNLGGSQDLNQTLALLSSRQFIDAFLVEQNVLPALYEDQWDSAGQRWREGGGGVSSLRARLSAWIANLTGDRGVAVRSDRSAGPSMWYAYGDFTRLLRVEKDRQTSLVTISIDWKDPRIAANWANALVQRLNRHIRDRVILEANRNLGYLDEQVKAVNSIELQQVMYRLVEREQRKAMLASVNEEYALRVLDPAAVPEQRRSPQRTLMVLASALLGLFVGAGVVIGRHLLRTDW
jgi:uncharacterized protein involved in exopolysaccharide biosynthesis